MGRTQSSDDFHHVTDCALFQVQCQIEHILLRPKLGPEMRPERDGPVATVVCKTVEWANASEEFPFIETALLRGSIVLSQGL